MANIPAPTHDYSSLGKGGRLGKVAFMKVIIQRVSEAAVSVDGTTVGRIGTGFLVLLGVRHADTEDDARFLARKTVGLRVFSDAAGKMNEALNDIDGAVLVISQFTLYGDTRKGNRPSFVGAAPPEQAEALYTCYIEALRSRLGADRVAAGRFGAMMQVSLTNEGPVTIELSTDGN